MARPRLELGQHGEIEAFPMKRIDGKWKRVAKARGAEQWRARAYYRGYDGVRSEISARGATRRDAVGRVELRLIERLSDGDLDITSNTPMVSVAEQWLTQVKRPDSG